MKTSLLTLALTAACTASPIGNIEARGANIPAVVQFFYDTQCTALGSQISMIPKDQSSGAVHGGPWGSRSAFFVATGDLRSWAIQDSMKDPQNVAKNPDIAQCISWPNGLYVTGSNQVVINTKPHHG